MNATQEDVISWWLDPQQAEAESSELSRAPWEQEIRELVSACSWPVETSIYLDSWAWWWMVYMLSWRVGDAVRLTGKLPIIGPRELSMDSVNGFSLLHLQHQVPDINSNSWREMTGVKEVVIVQVCPNMDAMLVVWYFDPPNRQASIWRDKNQQSFETKHTLYVLNLDFGLGSSEHEWWEAKINIFMSFSAHGSWHERLVVYI